MPTPPSQVRAALAKVTAAAVADVLTVAGAADSPTEIRDTLFAAVPLIVADYSDGTAALALDWYEDLRDAANPAHRFTPVPITEVRDEHLATTVAWSTASLYALRTSSAADVARLLTQAVEESMALLLPEVQKEVAAGFRDTITGNADADPDAAGWQRFAQAHGCKFCQMLASRGAVYTKTSVRFAAHTNCLCVAGPSFDPHAPHASVLQYVASRRTRSEEQKAYLRDYLNENFPDAPG